jgi:hypothetical protein
MNKTFVVTADGQVSDGYHTFGELYEHRIALWIALCRVHSSEFETPQKQLVWRSKLHSDGSSYDGWFLLGMNRKPGEQITYHLPMAYWDRCSFAATLDRAPEFDGHTPQDVLERLRSM